jgi:hypothetical protein
MRAFLDLVGRSSLASWSGSGGAIRAASAESPALSSVVGCIAANHGGMPSTKGSKRVASPIVVGEIFCPEMESVHDPFLVQFGHAPSREEVGKGGVIDLGAGF